MSYRPRPTNQWRHTMQPFQRYVAQPYGQQVQTNPPANCPAPPSVPTPMNGQIAAPYASQGQAPTPTGQCAVPMNTGTPQGVPRAPSRVTSVVSQPWTSGVASSVVHKKGVSFASSPPSMIPTPRPSMTQNSMTSGGSYSLNGTPSMPGTAAPSGTNGTQIPRPLHRAVYQDAVTSWWPPATVADWQHTIDMLAAGGYTCYIMCFLLVQNSNSVGPTDAAQIWTQAFNPNMTAANRAAIVSYAHSRGVSMMVSCGGATVSWTPELNGYAIGKSAMEWAINHQLDGVDFDLENFAPGQIPLQLIADLTQGAYDAWPANQGAGPLITHAPQTPYFGQIGDSSSWAGVSGGYTAIATGAAKSSEGQAVNTYISWYNVQFYNQGSNYYDDPSSFGPLMAQWGVPANQIVVGKPIRLQDAGSGWVNPSVASAPSFIAQLNALEAKGVAYGGIMGWQYDANDPATVNWPNNIFNSSIHASAPNPVAAWRDPRASLSTNLVGSSGPVSPFPINSPPKPGSMQPYRPQPPQTPPANHQQNGPCMDWATLNAYLNSARNPNNALGNSNWSQNAAPAPAASNNLGMVLGVVLFLIILIGAVVLISRSSSSQSTVCCPPSAPSVRHHACDPCGRSC